MQVRISLNKPFKAQNKTILMTDVTFHLSPVVTEDLLCPSILVSGAGTSDGFYKIAAEQRTAWAPGRQVYEHSDGDRYFYVFICHNAIYAFGKVIMIILP